MAGNSSAPEQDFTDKQTGNSLACRLTCLVVTHVHGVTAVPLRSREF